MRFGRFKVLGWAVVCAMVLAPAAFAQLATGNIYGTVSDESGAVLPGATVTLSGEFGTRTTTSGSEGEFRFLKVDHGTHALKAALTGFAGVTRDVIVTIGSNIQLDFTLNVATVEETVTVTAETPVVDSKKLGTATYVSQAELAQIPSSRDPWALMRTVPGILVDRVNVAGSESGQQAQYYGKGADPKDQNWTLDGIAGTDEVSWSSPSYWSYDTFDEMNVTTAGTDITIASGGMGINLVTKRGSNSFHGSAGGYLTHDDLQWSNLAGSGLEGDSRLQGNDKADHADQISDISFDLGGPIIKDKLWFYAGYGRNDIRIRRLTQTGDKTVLENKTFKLNWQAGPNDMVSAFWFNGAKIKIGRSASGFQEDASHTRDQGNGYVDGRPHGLSKLEWNHIFSPNFVFNTKVAYYNTGFNLTPQGGLDQPEVLDAVNQLAQGSSRGFDYLRPQTTANVDANYFKGSHEIKFGVGFRRMGSQVIAYTPGASKVQVTFQTSGQAEARFYRDGNSNGGTDHW
ncbi:MAG: TonB-dependent receptor, partial [Planctomycetota bacterium]